MRIKIRGINTVRKRLSDGSVAHYHYHRATGARLPGLPNSPEFLCALAAAEQIVPKNVGNINALIREYLLSLSFSKKKKSTQNEYKRLLLILEARFGNLPIKALESPKVRGLFLDYQEEIGRNHPHEADHRLTMLSIVLGYATRKGRIKENPLRGFERIGEGDRSELIWAAADVVTFMRNAPLELQEAMILALHTGQRYGDLIRLSWNSYQAGLISLKQGKTKARVVLHVSKALARMLDGMPQRGDYILARPDRSPWFTERNDKELSKRWGTHMIACGLRPQNYAELSRAEQAKYLRFSDLRGTAVTLLAEAGNGIPQICAVTGHTLQSATRILEKYLAMTPALSKAAILAFENSEATAFATQLQTGPVNPKEADENE